MNPERSFRLVAYAEGASFLALLFVAMPLKYWAGMPLPVRIVGSLHGLLFVLYVVLVLVALVAGRFNLRTAALALLASLLPFAPFVFAHKISA